MLKFTKEHEWIRVEGATGTVGITDYAQSQLGDIVFVDLPEIGRTVEAGKDCAVVESVKAASEIFAPVSGTVAEVNTALADAPQAVNSDPLGTGWFVKLTVSNPKELDGLMDQTAYDKYLAGL